MEYKDYKQFIAYMARRYCQYGYMHGVRIEQPDLQQIGYICFMECVETYDPSKSKFISYLGKNLRWTFGRYVSKEKGVSCIQYMDKICRVKMPVVSYEHSFNLVDDKDEYDIFLLRLNRLNSREKFIVLNYHRGVTYLSEKFGVTKQRISAIYYRAIEKLKYRCSKEDTCS